MNRRTKVGEIVIRTRVVQSFGVDFPETAQLLFGWALAGPRTREMLSFSANDLPPTVNHMYIHDRGKRILSAEARAFRELVALSLGGKTWRPRGPVMAMVFFESPHWITKRHTLRDMDGDNRLKPLFDAIQAATGSNDSANWQIHAWKVASARTRTTVYLFALGDLIDWHP